MDNKNDGRIGDSNFTVNINKVTPIPNANAKSIEAVVKSGNKVTGYKLSDGQIVSKEQGIALAKAGEIKNIGVATNKGTEYLRTLPDEKEGNNLGSLPTITEG